MTKRFLMLVRPSRRPAVSIPLGARSVGHAWYPPRHQGWVKKVDYVVVFWGVRGTGVILMEGTERRLGPDQIALYFPGNQHDLHTLDEPWEVRWWTMDGPLAAPITAALGLTTGQIYDTGPAPTALFHRLESAIRTITPAGEFAASALAYELLMRAARGRVGVMTDEAVRAGLDLIHNDWRNPQLSVKTIAYRLGLHRSSFSRRFRAAVGVSPLTYLINLRVQNALSHLKADGRGVSEVAHRCGWTDPNYFSRCIHRATGLSPREFRRH